MFNLEPSALWTFFFEITKIPRPSKKEEQIRAYLIAFANKHKLEYKVDEVGNTLIKKNGTSSHSLTDAVVLQAHMDMVCEKISGLNFNFETDPIPAYIKGDWIRSKGTTLGADNGIGMAMMLAVLSSEELEHPPLECLFTVDEETGLTGAYALKKSFLQGKTLINLDSEDDGVVYVGCAGGVTTTAILDILYIDIPQNTFAFTVGVKGLKGGHSGDDIHRGYGNAIKLLFKYLKTIQDEMDVWLYDITGGNLHNAIPREASVRLAVPYTQKERIRVLLNCFIADIERELHSIEPHIKFHLESEENPQKVIEKQLSSRIIDTLSICPNGVISMSKDISDLVETSTNLASINLINNNKLVIVTSQRSSFNHEKLEISRQVASLFKDLGADITSSEGYPGWSPELNSNILKIANQAYKELFHKDVQVKVIHAGLECGLIKDKYPAMEMISIGPQMHGVHSPNEQLNIPSTVACWDWLVLILKML